MKKILIVLLAVAILAAAGIALAGVANSPHDVTKLTSNPALEPCAYCHTPHQGPTGFVPQYPLWNRNQAAQTYTPYTSNTFEMGPASADIDRGSAPCMVCHNGVASSLVNYPGRGSTPNASYNLSANQVGTLGNNFANLGTDLQNEHPISFTYNCGLDLQGNNFPLSGSGTIAGATTNFPLYEAANEALGTTGTQFSCSTCHTVHHTPVAAYSHDNGIPEVYFLRTSNAGSAMCAECHTTKL